jgi:hypothetical protein
MSLIGGNEKYDGLQHVNTLGQRLVDARNGKFEGTQSVQEISTALGKIRREKYSMSAIGDAMIARTAIIALEEDSVSLQLPSLGIDLPNSDL